MPGAGGSSFSLSWQKASHGMFVEWLSRCEETVVRKLLSRLRRLFAMILFLLIITTFWRRTSFWRRMVHILSG